MKSFISSIPATDQRKQLSIQARVKGRGIDLADFVSKTFFKVESGLANIKIHNTTPSFPTIDVAAFRVKVAVSSNVHEINATTPMKCWSIIPGEVRGDLFRYF